MKLDLNLLKTITEEGLQFQQGGESKNIQYKTGVDAKTLKQFIDINVELFNENPTKAPKDF